MKWRKKRTLIVLISFLLLVFQLSLSYVRSLTTSDRVKVYTGIVLKPSTQHEYLLSKSMLFRNVTLNSATLGLSKSVDAFNIKCTTEGIVNTTIHQWFEDLDFRTRFKVLSEKSSVSFTINVASKGKPKSVQGVTSWEYDEDTTTVSLICKTGATVLLIFQSVAGSQIDWIGSRIPMFMGLFGLALCVISPTIAVNSLKHHDFNSAIIWLLLMLPIGVALVVSWLWR